MVRVVLGFVVGGRLWNMNTCLQCCQQVAVAVWRQAPADVLMLFILVAFHSVCPVALGHSTSNFHVGIVDALAGVLELLSLMMMMIMPNQSLYVFLCFMVSFMVRRKTCKLNAIVYQDC